ncbi:MAG: hypothetical protein ABWX68_00305 [Arthrobacter sp.]|uniref:hypothetical protein n=1 Tax=Arthrobacter sp. TaxID=1667 RepID=UPI003494E8ED
MSGNLYRRAALAACVPGLLLLAACSGTPYEDSHRGLPESVAPGDTGEPFAVWTDHPDRFAVVLYGSSSCPPRPESLSLEGPDTIILTLEDPPSGPCTADLAPTTYDFAAPAGLQAGADVTIRMGASTLTLSAPS